MVKSRSGFTIVELLIVIVVIAILAAISIVAYNGVQERSMNLKTVTGTKEYIKALTLFAVDNNAYPTAQGCMGEGYSYNGNVNRCGGNASVYPSPALDADLAKYLGGSKPSLDTTNIWISTSQVRAGGYFAPNVGTYGVVYYILQGTTGTCDAGGSKVLSSTAGTTGFYCAYSLPKP